GPRGRERLHVRGGTRSSNSGGHRLLNPLRRLTPDHTGATAAAATSRPIGRRRYRENGPSGNGEFRRRAPAGAAVVWTWEGKDVSLARLDGSAPGRVTRR